MVQEITTVAGVVSAAATLAKAVRGRESRAFGPNVWKGPATRRALALTFDDGPCESTPELLELLERFGARATFFQCGANAERHVGIARAVSGAGHEIGNHTYSHPRLYLRRASFVRNEIAKGQSTLQSIHGTAPKWFRAPYGARWFGMRRAMKSAGLTHVAWTTIARDWTLDAPGVVKRCQAGAAPGAILCLHDGRELGANPDIRVTLEAVAQMLGWLRDEGFGLVTLSELLCQKK